MIRIEFEAPDTRGLGEEAMRAAWYGMSEKVLKATLALLNSFKRTVGGPGAGRAYRRTKSGKVHRAALPGQPPARDYGDYVNSFDWVLHEGLDVITGGVGSRLWNKRGKHLELGTSKMRPRPHVEMAVNAARPEIDRALSDE